MPTYVYKFVETGETIEVQQSFTDDPLTEALHPTLGTVLPVKKVFTPVGVTFKGGGFYKTDSRGKSASSSSGSTSSGSTSSGSTPSDSTSTSSTSTSGSGSTSSGSTSDSGTTSSGSTSTSGATGD